MIADSIASPNEQVPISEKVRKVFYKFFSLFQVVVFIALWAAILNNGLGVGHFTKEEIITYLLVGNLLGLFSGFFLDKIMESDIYSKDSNMIMYKPVLYFFRVLKHGIARSYIPFLLAVFGHILLIYIFMDNFVINKNPKVLFIISLMVVFSFVTEFLIKYLMKIEVWWLISAGEKGKIIFRLKKFFAGSYIPLSLLPPVYLQIGLLLPFAYSFFVPMELFLGKISIKIALYGCVFQLAWIIVLYLIIRRVWQRKREIQRKKDIQENIERKSFTPI